MMLTKFSGGGWIATFTITRVDLLVFPTRQVRHRTIAKVARGITHSIMAIAFMEKTFVLHVVGELCAESFDYGIQEAAKFVAQ